MRSLASAALLAAIFAPPAVGQSAKLPAGVKADKDVAYGDHERQKLDVFYPEKPPAKPLPLVIWVHGGGWEAGNKEGNPAAVLLAQGYAVAGINYRLSQHAVFPAQINDCKAAVRFLRANAKKYNLDPEKFGVWGASAGGHLVALLGTAGGVKDLEGDGKHKDVSSKVQAVCDWFGPTKLSAMSPAGSPKNPITKLMGGGFAENKELFATADPITHVTKDTPPFLIVHGDSDKLVPLSQSELLRDALKKAEIPVELLVPEGGGHGDQKFREAVTTGEFKGKIVAFFDKHLKN